MGTWGCQLPGARLLPLPSLSVWEPHPPGPALVALQHSNLLRSMVEVQQCLSDKMESIKSPNSTAPDMLACP